jgi:hypothetical protein
MPRMLCSNAIHAVCLNEIWCVVAKSGPIFGSDKAQLKDYFFMG